MDLLFSAKEGGALMEMDQSIVVLRRMHDTNMLHDDETKSSEYIHAIKSFIIRKKAKRSTSE